MNFMASRRGFHEDGGAKGWFDNNNNEDNHNQEDENGPIRGYPEQPDQFMMDSSSPTNPAGEDSSDGHGSVPGGGGGGLGVGLGIGRSSSSSTAATTGGEIQVIEKEHMFDKVVTPSDVGKLNRLVIPKQHAEKYFPLDSSTNEKGLLLNFEDRNGKPWRFRYSYWNSSQSYVMTKGWSRFVKEKKLDAGDIVSFQRGVGEFAKDRLFIDWRRRPDAPDLPPPIPAFSLANHFSFRPGNQHHLPHHHHHHHHHHHPFLLPPRDSHLPLHLLQASHGYSGNTHHYGSSPSGSVFYLRPTGGVIGQQVVQLQRQGSGGGGSGGIGSVGVEGMPVHQHHHQHLPNGHHYHPMVFESVPVVQGKAAAKRLRLFGVNMECPIPETDECDILSSTVSHNTTLTPHHHLSSSTTSSPSSYPSTLPSLRPYNAATDVLNKGKASMSLDLDI